MRLFNPGSVSRVRPAFVVALLLLIFAIQLVHVARVYSANWDEAHHLYDGYNIWTRGDYRLNAEVPPLVKLVAALPLIPLHPKHPPDPGKSQTENAFLEGRLFLSLNGVDHVLFPARIACMAFTLVLGWLLYAATRHLFSTAAGVAALSLFVFDPLVLAHGTLVSTDVPSALMFFASVYAFYRYTRQPRATWLLTAGVIVGLAMVTKFTGILIAPMLALLCVAEGIRLHSWATLGRRLAACCLILAIGWAVLWAVYGFRYAPAPGGLALSPPLAPYLASLPNKSDGVRLASIARLHLLPEAYLWGLANTKHLEWEYTSFFFGRMYRHGPWQYFPAAFLIKSTLPLLLLLLLAPVVWLRSRLNKREFAFLLVPVAVYAAVITTSHFDIGARHLMPIYPFLYVAAGATMALAWRAGRAWKAAAALLLVWQAATSLRVAPAYMAYGNELWGGPLQVRNYLSDANVDWGQQLKTVKQYLDTNHIQEKDCWFAYFPDGAIQPADYNIACRRLPTGSGLFWFDLPMVVPPKISGTILISESDLEGVESGDGPLNPYDHFRGLKPKAVLQDGVYVFQGEFAVPLAAAWLAVRDSSKMARLGRTEAALASAREAVLLAPDQARTQSNLAALQAAQGDWQSAFLHYQLAKRWLTANRPELESDEFARPVAEGIAQAERHLQ